PFGARGHTSNDVDACLHDMRIHQEKAAGMDAVAASRRPVRKVRTNSRQAMSKSCAGRRAAPAGGLRQTTYCCAAPANL
ncbi:hypothetical protein ABTJ37_23850, partial [Acinetobacter baumannii]